MQSLLASGSSFVSWGFNQNQKMQITTAFPQERIGKSFPTIHTSTLLVLPKPGECSYRKQASPIQLSLAPVIKRYRSKYTRTCTLWDMDYCIHTDTKSEQEKTSTQTATSVGSPLHHPLFQRIIQKLHGLPASVLNLSLPEPQILSENISICGLQFYQ